MSPLEKVPFATFYPLQKYLRGTCFFQKRLFQVDSYIDVQGWFYVFNFIDWRNFFLHHWRALSAKNANHLQTTDTIKRHQRYSIRYHCGGPSLWTWGSATHYGLPALPEPFLRACGLHRVCTGFVQGLHRVCTGYQKIKTAEQFTLLPDLFATPICYMYMALTWLTVPNHLYLTSATDGHVVNSVNSMNLGMMSSSVFV